jgi:YggT family protein
VGVVATVIYIAVSLFIVVMWVRLVFDLVQSFSRTWRPRGLWLIVAEVAYVVSDPPVKAVRRVVPPLRVGGVQLDFAWSIVLLAAIIVSSIALGRMNG